MRRLIPPGRERDARAFLVGAAVGAFLALLPWQGFFLSVGRAWFAFQDRRAERRALAPMVEEARSSALTYDAIRRRPQVFKDRFVLWCVDHPAKGVSYLAGRPSQPLLWSNEDFLPSNSPTSGNRCTEVLAAVEGAPRAQGLLLRYIGLP